MHLLHFKQTIQVTWQTAFPCFHIMISLYFLCNNCLSFMAFPSLENKNILLGTTKTNATKYLLYKFNKCGVLIPLQKFTFKISYLCRNKSKPHIYVGIGILLQEHASVRSVNHYIVWTAQYNQVVFLICLFCFGCSVSFHVLLTLIIFVL